MRILALDLAKTMGWAMWDSAEPDRLRHGRVAREFSGSDLGPYLVEHMRWVEKQAAPLGPEADLLVVYELPFLGQNSNQAVVWQLMGLACATEIVCTEEGRDVPVRQINNSTVRKHFIGTAGGKGRTRAVLKAMTIAECEARGWDPIDDNAADALAVLDCAACMLKLKAWPWLHGRIGAAAR